jgi:hypothetical protein
MKNPRRSILDGSAVSTDPGRITGDWEVTHFKKASSPEWKASPRARSQHLGSQIHGSLQIVGIIKRRSDIVTVTIHSVCGGFAHHLTAITFSAVT